MTWGRNRVTPFLTPGQNVIGRPVLAPAEVSMPDPMASDSVLRVGDQFSARLRVTAYTQRIPGESHGEILERLTAQTIASEAYRRINAGLEAQGQDARIALTSVTPDPDYSTITISPDDEDFLFVFLVVDVVGTVTENAIPVLAWVLGGLIVAAIADALVEKITGFSIVDATLEAITKIGHTAVDVVSDGLNDVVIDPLKDLGVPIIVTLLGGLALFLFLGKG